MGNTFKGSVIISAWVLMVSLTGVGEACIGNGSCANDEFCRKTSQDCHGSGICEAIPSTCPLVATPVCGCNGVTYTNDCLANMARVNVAYYGECDCEDNSDCAVGQYCAAHVPGDCFSPGTCENRPFMCQGDPAPVCGCDGTSYTNECIARLAGVNADYSGDCTSTCTNNADCAALDYCQKDTDGCRSIGSCQTMPISCAPVTDPVCGCNGVTYTNACAIQMAGMNVLHSGACGTGCESNDDCDLTEYCNSPNGKCAAIGICVLKPTAGPTYYYPVCGCNGNTYFNASMAAANSAAIAVDLPCPIYNDGYESGDTTGWSGP